MSQWLSDTPWSDAGSDNFDEIVGLEWRSIDRLTAIDQLFSSLVNTHGRGDAYGGFDIGDLVFRSAASDGRIIGFGADVEPSAEEPAVLDRQYADVRAAALVALSILDRRRITAFGSQISANPPGGLTPEEQRVWRVCRAIAPPTETTTADRALTNVRSKSDGKSDRTKSIVKPVLLGTAGILVFVGVLAAAFTVRTDSQPPPSTTAPTPTAEMIVSNCAVDPAEAGFRQFSVDLAVDNVGEVELGADASMIMLVVNDDPAGWRPIEDADGRSPTDEQTVTKLTKSASEDPRTKQLVGSYAIPANPDGYKQLLQIEGTTAASLVTEWPVDRLKAGDRTPVGRLVYFVPESHSSLAVVLLDDANQIIAAASCPGS